MLAGAPHQQWFAALLSLAFGGPGLVILEMSYHRRSRPGHAGGEDPGGGKVNGTSEVRDLSPCPRR